MEATVTTIASTRLDTIIAEVKWNMQHGTGFSHAIRAAIRNDSLYTFEEIRVEMSRRSVAARKARAERKASSAPVVKRDLTTWHDRLERD